MTPCPRLLVPLLLAALPAAGAETAAFLKIVPGARPMALGGAFTAVADDLNALHANPAGLAQLGRRELALTHAELFAGIRYDVVAYAQPLRGGLVPGTLALGARRLSHGGVEGRDESGRAAGSFGASDTALELAYSRGVPGVGLLGVGARYVESRLADASGRTFALDLGVLRPIQAAPVPLALGLSVQNLGPGLRLADETQALPLAAAVGLSCRLLSGVAVSADVRHRPRAGGSSAAVGTEYALLPALSLRAGYLSAVRGPAGPAWLQGMRLGFGLRVRQAMLDYSFTPQGELGDAQRLSLGVRF